MAKLQMNAEELESFLAEMFGDVWASLAFETIDLALNTASFRLTPQPDHVRPGGTLSGPTMFAFADVGAYALINAHTGPRPLTVTTNLNINFMRKPEMAPIIGNFTLLKLGKRLAVVDVQMFSEDKPDAVVAQATTTYAIQQVS